MLNSFYFPYHPRASVDDWTHVRDPDDLMNEECDAGESVATEECGEKYSTDGGPLLHEQRG